MKTTFLVLAAVIYTVNAWAATNLPSLDSGKGGIGAARNANIDDYRMGDEWGKAPDTLADLNRAPPSFRRAAQS